jgi:hypothetical protein
MKHSVQRLIRLPTQHLLWDRGKPQRTLIELTGRRNFRMQTDFQPASPGFKYAKPNISLCICSVALFEEVYIFVSTAFLHNLDEQQTVVYNICREGGKSIRTQLHASIHIFTYICNC